MTQENNIVIIDVKESPAFDNHVISQWTHAANSNMK